MNADEVYDITPEKMQELSDEFNRLTFSRHTMGAEEYGEFAFLGNDMVQFIAEELADISNYCRYTYMKLRILQEAMNASGLDLSTLATSTPHGDADGEGVPSGFASSTEASSVLQVLPGGEGVEDPGQRSS